MTSSSWTPWAPTVSPTPPPRATSVASGWPGLLVNPGGAAARGRCPTGPGTSRRSATSVASNRGHPQPSGEPQPGWACDSLPSRAARIATTATVNARTRQVQGDRMLERMPGYPSRMVLTRRCRDVGEGPAAHGMPTDSRRSAPKRQAPPDASRAFGPAAWAGCRRPCVADPSHLRYREFLRTSTVVLWDAWGRSRDR